MIGILQRIYTLSDKKMLGKSDEIFQRWRKFCSMEILWDEKSCHMKILSKSKILRFDKFLSFYYLTNVANLRGGQMETVKKKKKKRKEKAM